VLRAHGGELRLAESTAAGTVFALELPAGFVVKGAGRVGELPTSDSPIPD